ncbi:hypothetical protein [Natronosalvus caseinilyticus]|uniref:hypothetical protein n=1 Tax=Natronosalvus caseinilyticus TaxID=2953747 RepID=UPI0028A77367|nr:hypothetical protein [Natronosalvus caseinilyticus]
MASRSRPRPTTPRTPGAISLLEALQATDADVVAYDPIAVENMAKRFPEIAYANSW